MNEIKMFENEEFGQVRTIEVDGKILFCGSDVAKALGYSSPKDAISTHCKGAIKHRTLTNGGEQDVKFITEGDVYRLITRSKLPSAEKFEAWVFDDVLPSIRRHGAYMTPSTLEQAIADPDFFIGLMTQLKKEREEKRLLEQKIEEDKPFTEHGRCVADASNCIDFNEFAKITHKDFELGRNKLFALLREKGILNAENIPYQKYINAGLFKVIQTKKESQYGVKTFAKTIITGKGQCQLFKLLKKLSDVA